MNIYIIKSKQPNCSICNLPLKECNPFADKHTHINCEADKIANSLIKVITKNLTNKEK